MLKHRRKLSSTLTFFITHIISLLALRNIGENFRIVLGSNFKILKSPKKKKGKEYYMSTKGILNNMRGEKNLFICSQPKNCVLGNSNILPFSTIPCISATNQDSSSNIDFGFQK